LKDSTNVNETFGGEANDPNALPSLVARLDSPWLFSHSRKLRAFRLSAVTVSLHYLPKMSAFNSCMRLSTFYNYLNWTFENLLPGYCYTIETNDRTIRSLVSQPASAGKRVDMSEL